jgi:tRNA pseudouridine38-40 synthase
MKIGLVVEFHGKNFRGWQRQPKQRTVQQCVEEALQVVLRLPTPPSVTASGRTDAGVHVSRMPLQFYLPEGSGSVDYQRLAEGVTALMKSELRVIDVGTLPDDFHVRKNAAAKEYVYTISQAHRAPIFGGDYLWHQRRSIDMERLALQLRQVIGTHDFRHFRASGCLSVTTVKTLFAAAITRSNTEFSIRFLGSGFLKQMVRLLVGSMLAFAQNRSQYSVGELLTAEVLPVEKGPTAPARGLRLERVYYYERDILRLPETLKPWFGVCTEEGEFRNFPELAGESLESLEIIKAPSQKGS